MLLQMGCGSGKSGQPLGEAHSPAPTKPAGHGGARRWASSEQHVFPCVHGLGHLLA